MNSKKCNVIPFLMLPVMFGVGAALANEPIIIADSDAEPALESQAQSSPNAAESAQTESSLNAEETKKEAKEEVSEEAKNAADSASASSENQTAEVKDVKDAENNFSAANDGETAAVEEKSASEDKETLNDDSDNGVHKKGEKKLSKRKKEKKTKNDYSEFLLPKDGYLPVGNTEDKQIQIQGSVSKTDELSLADCLELALQNNPRIKAAIAASSVVKEDKVQTVSNYAPSVSTQSGITRNKPDMSGMPSGFKIPSYTKYLLGTISLSQLVYDFGVTQNQYTIDKIDWEVSKQNIESVVNSVVCDVKDAYYNLLYAISAKQVRMETVEHFEQMYNQAKAFYEIGTKPKVDVTIASSNLADAKANYIEASNAVDLAVSKLNNIMGTPFIEPYIVNTSMPYQDTDITMRDAVEIANKARPDLQMAIAQVKKAEENVKLSKKSYAPSLYAAADLGMGGRDNFTDKSWYSVGGYFSFPVINPVMVTSRIKQAKAQLEQQKYDTKASINDIYFEIQNAFVKLTDAKQRIPASKAALQEARENYELSQGRYRAGVCDAIELKEAQILYEDAKLAYISNIYTYNSAKATLEKAIGQSLKPADTQENIEI